jgi:hypothetical protein
MQRSLLLASVFVGTFPVLPLHAQFSSSEGIHGSGSTVLERPAERMRMQVDLLAKSTKNLPDALAKLKAQRARVEKQLETLGADKASLKFSEPRLDESQDDAQQRMAMMVRQRMAAGGRGRKPGKEAAMAQPVKVAMRLTAEWPLKGEDPAGQLLEVRKLQDAIKAADLAGQKEAEELTPEEAELAEEMEDPEMYMGGRQGPKPGEPAFIFTARIPAADREKGLAEAFQNAKSEAASLAKAAEIELGPLLSLRSSAGLDSDDGESYQQMYNSPFGGLMRSHMRGNTDPGEAFGPAPGILKYRVGVMASFAIKPGTGSR